MTVLGASNEHLSMISGPELNFIGLRFFSTKIYLEDFLQRTLCSLELQCLTEKLLEGTKKGDADPCDQRGTKDLKRKLKCEPHKNSFWKAAFPRLSSS